MPYQAKNFENLLGLKGFSDQLLKNHFTLYQGYVANVNKLTESLQNLLDADKAGAPEFAELTRRLGWEFNGLKLHELYFENLKKGGGAPDKNSSLGQKIVADFGSLETWEKWFKAAGLMRGIGWVILYYEPSGQRLFNVWVNEHDTGHLAGSQPLLIMDVFEHAFMLDYGLKRADYLEAFFQSIDWSAVAARFKP